MLWSQIISLVSTAKVHHLNFVKYTMYQYIYIPMYFWNKLLTYLLKTYIHGSLMLKFVYFIGYPATVMKVKKYDKS